MASTIAAYPFWSSGDWIQISLSTLPNLLGFSIAALAIILAFPSVRLFRVLAERGAEDSYYIDMAGRLVHFIFVQVFAIFLTIFAKTYPGCGQNFIGCMVFFYAILVALASGLALFGVARIANAGSELNDQDLDEDPDI